MIKQIFEISAAILASLGGGCLIIFGLSSWLGKVWAERILQNERQIHNKELEKLRASLKTDVDSTLEAIKAVNQREMDYLLRKREVYQGLAQALRVFISSSIPQTIDDKKAFLRYYDASYLWASDETINAIVKFLDIMVENTANPNQRNESKVKELYEKCLIEMRKDCGFMNTNIGQGSYRFIQFN